MTPQERIKELRSQIDKLEAEINRTFEVGDVVEIVNTNIGTNSGGVGVIIEVGSGHEFKYRVWLTDNLMLWANVKEK